MKLSFEKDLLLKEITISQEIISTKTMTSVLSTVLLVAKDNILTIEAMDSKTGFIAKVPVTVEEEGSTTIFCDKFLGILNSISNNECLLIADENNVEIRQNKTVWKMKTISSNNFPPITSSEGENFFELKAADFKEMVRQTIFSASQEDRNVMNVVFSGILFEKQNDDFLMVSTDTKQLSHILKKDILQGIDDFPQVIVPPKILNIVVKRLSNEGNVQLAINNKNIFIKFDNYEFYSVLIDGSENKYPSFQKIINNVPEYTVTIRKSELEEAIRRATVISEKTENRIKLTFSENSLKINSVLAEIGESQGEIDCNYVGEEKVANFFFQYILNPMKVIDTEYINIGFSDKDDQILITSEPVADFLHIFISSKN